MKTVGIFEGKTKFSALVDRANHGEIIVLTKNGRPVAQIGPVDPELVDGTAKAAMKRILATSSTLVRHPSGR
ncbi:MAG: type II toxin-antitoxin system Phd/YefM family antitoxin [Vulcanimicrobiaceae bacterium]